ncbi:sialidase family protein [Horticoccus sp. 23ND18S-11]|uniref:sialidase family protein n=1 Tax=Horticoccus sp. 23ND18S-11 TaxID=3391832 RepID=UPI0039C978E3
MNGTGMGRREFIQRASLAFASCAVGHRSAFAAAGPTSPLVAAIEKTTLRGGPDEAAAWFHPRACCLPGRDGPVVFMTLQDIRGSDFFGPVHWMESRDLGRTWTEPLPVPALGRIVLAPGSVEGVCDVVPEYHPPTRSVLALGHNVFYNGPRFHKEQPPRCPVYSVWRNGQWSPRRKLVWDDPRGAYIYSNGCSQRLTLPDGDILLTFSFCANKGDRHAVMGVRCSFDGETLAVKACGEPLTHEQGRGLLEPSLVQFDGRIFMTLRAEDERAYVTTSRDGLRWEPKRAWTWDDGEPLITASTQQHWLAHSAGLFLVYTRKDKSNAHVFRWRAPLFMAQVNPRTLQLERSTERVVFPLVGDVVREPGRPESGIYEMGNFHTTHVSPDESWVTVGEWRPRNANKGDLLAGRIRWSQANRLAPG